MLLKVVSLGIFIFLGQIDQSGGSGLEVHEMRRNIDVKTNVQEIMRQPFFFCMDFIVYRAQTQNCRVSFQNFQTNRSNLAKRRMTDQNRKNGSAL